MALLTGNSLFAPFAFVKNHYLITAAIVIAVMNYPPLPDDPYLYYEAPDMIKDQGYKCETYHVTTDDGYVLTLHRVADNAGGVPVIIWHGMVGSSKSFMLLEDNLVGSLMKNGFDVWLPNSRGNIYGSNHTHLSAKSKAYWQFDFTHMASHDFPKVVEKVLAVANAKQAYYVCFSQGCSLAIASLAESQTMNEKIKKIYALGPLVYTPSLSMMTGMMATPPFQQMTVKLTELSGDYQIMKQSKTRQYIASWFGKIDCRIVSAIFEVMTGIPNNHVPPRLARRVFHHLPSGTSLQSFLLFTQMIQQKTFGKFDYGPTENSRLYGQPTPPVYNISNIKVPMEVYSGSHDRLAVESDIRDLFLPQLKAPYNYHFLENFGHWEIILGDDTKKLIYDPIVADIKRDMNT